MGRSFAHLRWLGYLDTARLEGTRRLNGGIRWSHGRNDTLPSIFEKNRIQVYVKIGRKLSSMIRTSIM